MLKRIQEISQVGCFQEDRPARVEFEGLTFLFGENCYGKSTLCDVLRSVGENRPEYIVERRSVPRTARRDQRVRLTFLPRGEDRESCVSFSAGRWSSGLPGSLKLHVFDTEFIHRNVFTGLSVERKNQENITRFVLGEEGVARAQEIADLRADIRRLRKELKELEVSAFEGITDLAGFLALQVTESQAELTEKMASCAQALDRARQLAVNLQEVRMRTQPSSITITEDLDALMGEIDDCLGSRFEQAHREALEAVERHILDSTANDTVTKDWLKKGLAQVVQEHCPFCGQPLGGDARHLLDSYRSLFDEAFDRFAAGINERMASFPRQLAAFANLTVPELLEANARRAEGYLDVLEEPGFRESVLALSQAASALRAAWGTLQQALRDATDELNVRLGQKKEAVYASFPPWEPVVLLSAHLRFVDSHSSYQAPLEDVVSRIQAFKDGLETDRMEALVSEREREFSDLQLKYRKLRSAAACSKYQEMQDAVQLAESQVARKQAELEQEQAAYLDRYFKRIDQVFCQLGSDGFTIVCQISRRGDLPTVQLTASYKGERIRSEGLKTFFSESDRRALALSVYWAKVESLSDMEKADAIVVLDDPITSFDDGRVDRTIRMLGAARHAFRQVIVMSHYPRFLKAFFERAKGETAGIRLAKIIRTDSGSKIESAAPEDFVDSEHHRVFRRIKDFAELRSREDVSGDLRVFLETEVRSRFRKAIEEKALQRQSFRALVEGLYDSGVLSAEQRNSLDELLDSLNPEHHIWTDRNHTEQVSLAKDVLELVYERL